MPTAPLNSDFSGWLVKASDGFDQWAQGLSQTEGFEEFIAYVRENGPLVAEATTAIANAVVQIVQASAPLGGPVLKAITGIANAISAIADSPLGTPIMSMVTAMSALSLATNAATAATLRLKAAQSSLGGGAAGSSGTKPGATVIGSIPAMAAVVGTIAGVNLVDNFVEVLQGDRGWREAGDPALVQGERRCLLHDDIRVGCGRRDDRHSRDQEQGRQRDRYQAVPVSRVHPYLPPSPWSCGSRLSTRGATTRSGGVPQP